MARFAPFLRFSIAALTLVAVSAGARAQAPADTVQLVQGLAPHLVTFAGSPQNFSNLVTGLAQGTEIQLVSVTANGAQQTARFTPTVTGLSPTEIVQALETARQSLIAQGVAQPNAAEIGASLTGVSNVGVQFNVPQTTVIDPRSQQLRFAGSEANLQNLVTGLSSGGVITLFPVNGGSTVSFFTGGGPMTPEEVERTLDLARRQLAAQGIVDPTPEQIRVALTGGTIATATTLVDVPSIVEQRFVPGTDIPRPNVSDSPQLSNVSDSPPRGVTADAIQLVPGRQSAPAPLLQSGASAGSSGRLGSAPAATPVPPVR